MSAPGGDEPLVWYEGAGTADKRWLVADERGSVVAVTDAGGNAIDIKAYDEFGIPSDTAPANAGRFGYTGQVWLPDLGMNYYKARMYSPTLGRFLQTDPIGYGDGLNWHNYAGGDPINATDPSGMVEEPIPPPIVVIGRKLTRCEMEPLADGCYTSPFGQISPLDGLGFTPGGGGFAKGLGPAPTPGRSAPQRNSKACQILRAKSDSSKSQLPGYLTGNDNWNDPSTLRGYRNLYQSSNNEYSAASGPVVTTLITVATTAFSLTPAGAGWRAAVISGGASLGAALSLSALKDSTGAAVSAINDRLNVLEGSCR